MVAFVTTTSVPRLSVSLRSTAETNAHVLHTIPSVTTTLRLTTSVPPRPDCFTTRWNPLESACSQRPTSMPLSAGSQLGPYQILTAIGAGGMGEVFRARDTKLNRFVAIKVLPDLFASDPERLARFKREAQLLAAINHTNIAHIHEFQDSTGIHALVMELVEGPTLADRIE